MEWTPNEQVVRETVEVFRSATSSELEVQKKVNAGIESLRARPDGIRYLACIFAHYTTENVECRQMAGLLLKNTLALAVSGQQAVMAPLDSSAMDYVRSSVLKALCDEAELIRLTAGTIITTILTKSGCEEWPEALTTLTRYVRDAPSVGVAKSALDTFKKIAEDELDNQQWDVQDRGTSSQQQGQFIRVSNEQFIPLLFQMCQTPGVNPELSLQALEILEIYNERHVFAFGEFATHYFDTFWSILGRAAVDERMKTKLVVLKAMCTVMEYNSDAIIGNAKVIFDLFVRGSADAEYQVRLVALGFWPEILKDSSAHPLLSDVLAAIIPILVEHTTYTKEDYAELDQAQLEDDNAGVPDVENLLAPRFHVARGDDESDDEGDQRAKSAWGDVWTVRKASALALDSFALAFRAKLLPHCLMLIEQKLQNSSSWEIRESGVLSLGAISKGCLFDLDQFVPNVLSLLIKLSEDCKPLLRSISCWCLNRFAPWFCQDEYCGQYLSPVLMALLKRMLDRNKCVQEAACSAVAGLEETAKTCLIPDLPSIFECFSKALSLYQSKNMNILYDAIGTLANCLGPALVESYPRHYSQILLEPFFLKWQQFTPGDYQTAALCECMGFVAQAVGPEILPMAPLLVEKCTLMMSVNILKIQSPDVSLLIHQEERVSTDVLECCLDLLSYLADTTGAPFVPVMQQHNFMPLVELCCTDASLATYMSVKQSAFALVGDLAPHCTPMMIPHLEKIIPSLATHLTANVWAVSSNASWALGQLVDQLGPEPMSPYATFIAQQLCGIITQDFGNISLRQNACITLGRYAGACPHQIAELLPQFLGPWCQIMTKYQAENEKAKSFKGLMKALVLNANAAQANKPALITCANSFYHDDNLQPVPPPSGSQRNPRVHPDIEPMLQNLMQWLSSFPVEPTL